MNTDIRTWAIYDHPEEYPHHYAVKAYALRGRRLTYAGECSLFPSLEDARESLIRRGLVPVPPNPAEPDRTVLELWL